MMITTLQMNNGRVTIPEHIRKELKLDPNDIVEIEVRKPKGDKE